MVTAMNAETSRAQKLLEVKRKLATQRLTRIAQCNPRATDWAEATGAFDFQRSFAKEPNTRNDIDIENILLGLKTCRALQV
jgi:hypothetical protein